MFSRSSRKKLLLLQKNSKTRSKSLISSIINLQRREKAPDPSLPIRFPAFFWNLKHRFHQFSSRKPRSQARSIDSSAIKRSPISSSDRLLRSWFRVSIADNSYHDLDFDLYNFSSAFLEKIGNFSSDSRPRSWSRVYVENPSQSCENSFRYLDLDLELSPFHQFFSQRALDLGFFYCHFHDRGFFGCNGGGLDLRFWFHHNHRDAEANPQQAPSAISEIRQCGFGFE